MDRHFDWTGKTVLITGGTGTFGKNFVRYMLTNHRPKKIIIYSRDEFKQHQMRQLMENDPRLRYFLGDVRDLDRMVRAFDGIDVVLHAAALKQVPACEYNPFEAVKTNVVGSQNVISAAIDAGVGRVMAISTDKAVDPINLYGATKLTAERLFLQGNVYSQQGQAIFSCIRYGNVHGSRGSVVPLFQKQASEGEVTLTDDRMTRFWLTIDQAVRFVDASVGRMRGGEIFIPKLPSVRMTDLAEAVAPGVPRRVIGVRPGEKIHETLVSNFEAAKTYEYDQYFVVHGAIFVVTEERRNGGRPVSPGFSYASNTNGSWLTVEQIRELVEAEEGRETLV